MSNASSLNMTQLAGKEPKTSTSIKVNGTRSHFYNLISLSYSCKQSHSPEDKSMPKVISDRTEIVKVHINLASCSS